jgi:hypothetical protein
MWSGSDGIQIDTGISGLSGAAECGVGIMQFTVRHFKGVSQLSLNP